MEIGPNKTVIEGKVQRVEPAADGWGADVQFSVAKSLPHEGFSDFLGALPGSVVTMFAAKPEALTPGASYTVVASVRGGPRGERVVVERADASSDG